MTNITSKDDKTKKPTKDTGKNQDAIGKLIVEEVNGEAYRLVVGEGKNQETLTILHEGSTAATLKNLGF